MSAYLHLCSSFRSEIFYFVNACVLTFNVCPSMLEETIVYLCLFIILNLFSFTIFSSLCSFSIFVFYLGSYIHLGMMFCEIKNIFFLLILGLRNE